MKTPLRLRVAGVLLLFVTQATAANVASPTAAPTGSPRGPILTPAPPPSPRINGPSRFGVRPLRPFLYTIPATGDRPMTFSAEALPQGLTLDATTGRITGRLFARGEHRVTLKASNALGTATRAFTILVGDTIALTPPLGWNSWNCFAGDVSDAKIRAAADALVSSGLANHGWTYINVDDCWQADRDGNGRILSNEKFPDMKALSAYVHSKGLKFGIYSSPGPQTCAGFMGSFDHEDLDAAVYGEWEVDYVKYDWCSYNRVEVELTARCLASLGAGTEDELSPLLTEHFNLRRNRSRSADQTSRLNQLSEKIATIRSSISNQQLAEAELAILRAPYRKFRRSLDQVNRDMVYSLCQYGRGQVWTWGGAVGGNCWRTTGDITDTWNSMAGIGFINDGRDAFSKPGNWNDPDMLVVGWVGWGPDLHLTRLTPDEQYTHISLWCLLSAPLLIGCDMTKLDDFTLSLLSNDDVLAVNQDALGISARCYAKQNDLEVWAKGLEDGSMAVGLFNRGTRDATVVARWEDLGISGKRVVRDLWRQADLGSFQDAFTAKVAPHGVVLVKLSKQD
jgi:alpha-galactosidase